MSTRSAANSPLSLAPVLDETLPTIDQLKVIAEHFQNELQDIKSQLGGGLRWENFQSQLISVTFPGSGGSVTISHNLQRTPDLWVLNPQVALTVWATAADKAAWTSTTLVLRSDQPGQATLLVL
jgi:hypothetical protein